MRPLAVTGGDCAGVGPEIAARAMARFPEERFVVYTDRALFARACDAAGVPLPPNADWRDVPLVGGDAAAVVPGRDQALTGRLAHDSVVAAGQDALAGRVRGLVTAPFSKAALRLAGFDVPGHTELLARLCGREEATMAFFAPRLVVGLVTIHCALRDVPRLVTPERLLRALGDLAGALRRALGRKPRIGVLALNPHAGEKGAFGDEEARVIAPTLRQAADLADLEGPLVPDTAFAQAANPGRFDAFLAMYHDQGLIPFKLAAFDEGVNVTLGLPFVRTSPDHGTAFALAWQGRASADSMAAAINRARELTR